MVTVAWGISSVDEKQSPDGGLSNGVPAHNHVMPDHVMPDHVMPGHVMPAPTLATMTAASSIAAALPSPAQADATHQAFRSTPAILPPFTPVAPPSFIPHAVQHEPTASTTAPRFELTSLISVLPEPTPRPIADLAHMPPITTVTAVPEATAPSFIPMPPQPTPAQPPPQIPAAPDFTPFIAPSARPAAVAPPADPTIPPPVTPAAAPAPSTPSLMRRLARTTGRVARYAAIAATAWFITVLLAIALFRFVDPPASMLMLTKQLSGETLQHDWVPLSRVSNNLRRAVITAEDGKFCRHWGFDFGEIRAAMNSTEGFGRGASTITQQLAKNLFLWPGKSYVRKGLEVPLTLAIEALWSKQRIIEVYLNIAEWGPGVFGAQAASQYYYNKNATQLTEREAALLAVSLPNPIARDASDPNPTIARRASTLQSRMRVQGISYCALTPTANR